MLPLLLLCFGRAVLAAENEEPSLLIGFPKWGQTPKVCAYSWCEVPFGVRNPTNKVQELVVSVRALEHAEAQYSKRIRIGPGAQVQDSMYIVAERTEAYYATLNYADGRQIQNKQLTSNFQIPYRTIPSYFVTDDPEVAGVSALTRNKNLGKRLIVTRSKSADLPATVAGFGSTRLLVLTDVDFTTMNAEQFTAVEDFVAGGGTMAILRPATVVAMATTPLAPMLPATPLATRRIRRLPSLGAWEEPVAGDAGPLWDRGTDFLECSAGKDAHVALGSGVFPVVVWGRWGLGRVVVTAFDPLTEECRGTDSDTRIWRHVLSAVSDNPINSRATCSDEINAIAAKLIGFEVPSVQTIRNIMGSYLVLVVALFGLAAAVRKQVGGWIIAVAASLVLTGVILLAAGRQLRHQEPRNAVVLDVACQADFGSLSNFVGEKHVNLVNREDDRPDITALRNGVMLRPEAPPPATTVGQWKPTTIYSISREDSRSSLRRLDVRENKPVTFYASYRDQRYAGVKPPVLSNSVDGLQLRDCVLPEALRQADPRAFLLLANGCRRLRRESDQLTLAAESTSTVELDTVAQQIRDFLNVAPLPSPAIALFYADSAPSELLTFGDDSYAEKRHIIQLIPVDYSLTPGPVAIPPEELPLVPAGKGSRALYWEGQWQRSQLYGGTSSYLFAVIVPVPFRDMVIESADIDLALVNPGGTVDATVHLLPMSSQPAERRDDSGVGPVRRSGAKLYFEDLAGHRYINPVDGHLLLRLTLTSSLSDNKKMGRPVIEEWRVSEFAVSLQGRLPAADTSITAMTGTANNLTVNFTQPEDGQK